MLDYLARAFKGIAPTKAPEAPAREPEISQIVHDAIDGLAARLATIQQECKDEVNAIDMQIEYLQNRRAYLERRATNCGRGISVSDRALVSINPQTRAIAHHKEPA